MLIQFQSKPPKTYFFYIVSPEPSLLAHTSSESRGTFRHKARSLAPLNGWACAVKICHDGMLEDTNSLDAAHINNMNNCRKATCINVFNDYLKRFDFCNYIFCFGFVVIVQIGYN